MDMTPGEWRHALQLKEGDLPVAVITEGSWWRQEQTDIRLRALDDVHELVFPDMFWGRWQGRPIVYSCAYGAPRAGEVAHIFASMGASLVVHVGTCGSLQKNLHLGDIVVPDQAICQEGIARIYGSGDVTRADPKLSYQARSLLAMRNHTVHNGTTLTWASMFAQSGAMVEIWHNEGYLSVDMETATTLAVSRHFGVAAVSMSVVSEELLKSRRFLDPLEPDDQERLVRGTDAVFRAALDLVSAL